MEHTFDVKSLPCVYTKKKWFPFGWCGSPFQIKSLLHGFLDEWHSQQQITREKKSTCACNFPFRFSLTSKWRFIIHTWWTFSGRAKKVSEWNENRLITSASYDVRHYLEGESLSFILDMWLSAYKPENEKSHFDPRKTESNRLINLRFSLVSCLVVRPFVHSWHTTNTTKLHTVNIHTHTHNANNPHSI